MNLSHKDCLILESALSKLLTTLQQNVHSLPNTPAENVMLNISTVKSARKKIRLFSQNPQQQFSTQELKVMYGALRLLLENVRDFLAASPLTDPDRDKSLETQRICGRLLRYFDSLFAQDNIESQKLFGHL